jgi:sodium-dependent dicarboxylate transporter 2/3/5
MPRFIRVKNFFPAPVRSLQLLSGPLVFLLLRQLQPFEGLSASGHALLGVALWMAVWWLTEAVDMAATALLPLVLFPLCCGIGINETSRTYAHPYVFLFLGGFLLALAIEKWSLHKRLALHIVLLVGTAPHKLILGFMLATAFLSMWISNTAATVMMLPIALAVIRHQQHKSNTSGYAAILMLSIAYAASIGGMATLIGSPPNLVMAGLLKQKYGIELSFFDWFIFAFPLSVILLLSAWWYFTRNLKGLQEKEDRGSAQEIRSELAELGAMSPEEKKLALVFVVMAFLWTFRSLLLVKFIPALDDSLIAIAGGLLLFTLPAKGNSRLLNWSDTRELPWGILLLFGGGMALADGFERSGLAAWIGSQLTVLQLLPFWLILALLVLSVNFLTEITSNLATTAMLLPIVASMSDSLQVHPYFLFFGTTLAASCAFMLPVATPPNAIVFGTGVIPMKEMLRHGFRFNLMSAALISLLCYFLLPLLLNV